jgi:hypothetical protein
MSSESIPAFSQFDKAVWLKCSKIQRCVGDELSHAETYNSFRAVS